VFYDRKLVKTADGSHSLYVEGLNEHYHSVHGALQESQHVFIKMGLNAFEQSQTLRIYELGLGTGLNALLTSIESRDQQWNIHYTASEAYPLSLEEAASLNYGEFLGENSKDLIKIHDLAWAESVKLHPHFALKKLQEKSQDHKADHLYDLIYFDAFAPEKQPELWEPQVFDQMYQLLAPGGILTTYCAKGVVRRRMQASGFTVERLPGPPGKREMLRASKPLNESPN